jgi:multimeric flavodoxin WrbA
MDRLTAVALNCTLKPTGESSTDLLLEEVATALAEHDVAMDGPPVRVAALNVLPGVSSDEGDGDEWPEVRSRILAADILVIGTPIWMGQPSSVCKRVLERLDAFLGEKDDEDRMISYDRVAMVAVVGNEDGAHHVSAEVYQSLNDVGFAIAPNAVTYWVGEAMGSVDYKDLDEKPKKTAEATKGAAATTAHLAKVLKASPFPA